MTSSKLPTALLLPACPYCDYSMHGLPAEHRCPECGRAFEHTTRVFGNARLWRQSAGWESVRVVAVMMLLVCATTWFLWMGDVIRPWNESVSLVYCALAVLLAFCDQVRSPRFFVCVGRGTIRMVDRKGQTCDDYPLESLLDVNARRWLGLMLRTADGRKQLSRLHCSRQELKRCADYINSLIWLDNAVKKTCDPCPLQGDHHEHCPH